MQAKLSIILVSLLASQLPLVSGFRVIFYLGYQCRRARWGDGQYGYPGRPDVCHKVPTNAVSATIVRESNNGEDNSMISFFLGQTMGAMGVLADSILSDIAFWKEGCNVGLRGSGDGGECIDFSDAQWFSVREDWTVPGKKRGAGPDVTAVPRAKMERARIQPRTWELQQEQHRYRLNLTVETALGSLSPYFDPDIMGQAGVGHGNVSESYGQMVRWQQIALGITVGIPINEWDDAIHVKSDRYIPYGNKYNVDTTGHAACGVGDVCEAHWSLAERNKHMKRWNYADCRALLTCARNVAGGVDLALRDGWPQVVSCAVKTVAWGRTLYDHLSWRGMSCGVLKWGGAGLVGWGIGHIQTGGGATAEDNNKLAGCSNKDQASAFVETMLNAASASDENAARADISIGNGHTLVLYGKVYPHDKIPPNDLCLA